MMKENRYEKFYNILLILYIFNQVFSESQFINDNNISKFLTFVRYLVLVSLVAIIICRNVGVRKRMFLLLGMFFVFILLNLVLADGGISYFFLVFFVIASKDCSLERIFKNAMISLVVAHSVVVIAAKLGIVKDSVEFRYVGNFTGSFMPGAYYRHSMGFLVHNQVALCALIVYLYLIVYKRENLSIIDNVVCMLLNCWIFNLFGSRIVFLFCIVSCAMYYVIKLLKKENKLMKFSWSLVYPVSAILSYVATVCYRTGNSVWDLLDMIFNHRISQSSQAFEYYGLNIIGAGKNAGLYGANSAINVTVDNAYMGTLISSGLVVTVMLVGVWTYITYFFEKKNNRYLVLVLVILAVENLINTHLGSFKLIPFMCILMNPNDPFLDADFKPKGKNKKLKINW